MYRLIYIWDPILWRVSLVALDIGDVIMQIVLTDIH